MSTLDKKEISEKNIIESTLNGINESMEVYKKWSGGEWLHNAPEYLVTIKIAEHISNISGNKLITLEDNVHYILDSASATSKGQYPKIIRKNGRLDIVLWRKNLEPRAVIEVKNSVFRFNKIKGDIDRISGILKQKKDTSTLEFGLMAFYIDRYYKTGNAKEKVEEKIKKIHKKIIKNYSEIECELFFSKKEKFKNDTDYWASVVFLLKNKL